MKKSTFYWFVAVFGVVPVLFCTPLLFLFSRTSSPVTREMRVQQEFLAIGSAVKTYHINAGRPQTTAQGLDALVNEPTTGPKPRRWTQVMKKLPLDPWHTPYRYTLLTPKDHEWRWELRSAGPDGAFGSGDDMAIEAEWGDSVVTDESEGGDKVNPRPSF